MIFWKRKFLEKILITWTEKYDPIIATIEESKDIDKLIAIELMGSPEAHKKRLEMSCENDTENTFQSITNTQSQESKKSRRKFNEEKQKDNNSKYPPYGICKRKSHSEKEYWFKGKPQCRNCKKYGHVEKFCCLK